MKLDNHPFGRVAKTNGATAAAKVSAGIPARAFNGMGATIYLRRLWKIP
jgi:hypothetical protein